MDRYIHTYIHTHTQYVRTYIAKRSETVIVKKRERQMTRTTEGDVGAGGAIRIFYHIACINNWRDLVRDQFVKLLFSGLYEKAVRVHCFIVVTNPGEVAEVSTYLRSFGAKVSVENWVIFSDPSGADEWFTLSKMKTFVEPLDRVLYIHSKGVTRASSPTKLANVMDWRDVMDYHLIYRHEHCFEMLKRFETVGINYMGSPPHFSGNYWWCTGAHILTLSDEKSPSETFLLSGIAEGKNVSVTCIFQTPFAGGGHYNNPYPFKEYVDNPSYHRH